MAYTMQQIVDMARIPLNDTKKARYSDSNLLSFTNVAVMRVLELRPDLLFGTAYTIASSLAMAGIFPLPDRFAQTVADYVGGRAELKDEDASTQARAQVLMSLFTSELFG